MEYTSTLFTSNPTQNVEPDRFTIIDKFIPQDVFVLCRNSNGKSTATYGSMTWDFTPYRTSPSSRSIMCFEGIIDDDHLDISMVLINELKQIMFYLMYHVPAGKFGTLQISTLMGYFYALRQACYFCLSQASNPLIKEITLKELVGNYVYHQAFADTQSGKKFCKVWPALLNRLRDKSNVLIDMIVSDTPVLTPNDSNLEQTPIIPERIYVRHIDFFIDRICLLYSIKDRLAAAVFDMMPENSGYAPSKLKRLYGLKNKNDWPDTYDEIIDRNRIREVIVGYYGARNKHQFVRAIHDIYTEMRLAIHFFTGMRKDELLRTLNDCIRKEVISPEYVDKESQVTKKGRSVDIIRLKSTTTKFTGYKQDSAWIATPEVVEAVEVLETINKSLLSLYDCDFDELPLFANPSLITRREGAVAETTEGSKRVQRLIERIGLTITEEDYRYLCESNPLVDYSSKPEYQIGQPWPLRTHQCRRSLAFYAASSGHVRINTLRKQYKHLTREMTKYYAKNFERIKSIFGYYDPETKEYKLPEGHVAFEFQVAAPISQVDLLMADTIDSKDVLFGKTGGYIEKSKEKIKNGDVDIRLVRNDTLKKVENGEISYRRTLLGGCTKVGGCDCAILGEFSDCFYSECAVIKESNVREQIASLKKEMEKYDSDSGEYLMLKQELDASLSYLEQRIQR
ncbi:hypothetical protein QNE90_001010 [Vibrio alginolyticus]|nr:hypothetical protein [Vibrio alginolyticus]